MATTDGSNREPAIRTVLSLRLRAAGCADSRSPTNNSIPRPAPGGGELAAEPRRSLVQAGPELRGGRGKHFCTHFCKHKHNHKHNHKHEKGFFAAEANSECDGFVSYEYPRNSHVWGRKPANQRTRSTESTQKHRKHPEAQKAPRSTESTGATSLEGDVLHHTAS